MAVGVDKTAELIGISTATIRQYAARRRIASVRVGRRVLIPMETVKQILEEGVPRVGRNR